MRKYTRAYKFLYNSIFYNHVQIWIRQEWIAKTRGRSAAMRDAMGSRSPVTEIGSK